MSKRTFRPPETNPFDPPKEGYQNYIGYQKIINSDNGEINEEELEKHIEDITSKGWKEISVDFRNFELGDRIRYTTKTPKGEHLFRTGGWVISRDDEYDPSDPKDKGPKWLVYHAHTHTNWTVQRDDVQRLFYIDRETDNKQKKKSKIYFYPPIRDETSYNVYLTDKDGVKQRVFSARSKNEMDIFMNTDKFKRVLEGEKWEMRQRKN